MDENTKKIILIVVVVVALIAAGFSAYKTMAPQEEVVGTLDMGPGGGRDAEKGDANAAEDPSGMPANMR